ncbi:Rid family hydrolase [Micromonospora sp. DR5-3]|uniref:RidA family protein n=1 Tax=unclassified Micromonospora TaxID=2617518 RepID=UPI001CA36598|nr:MULTISPECIES: Rid family hydrolase [unclassified Micromonospora]MCW3815776.1 Rid family hydrolase [Micromonospora sp. DR5-3]
MIDLSARRAIIAKGAAAPTASYSQGIAFGNVVVTAGQVGSDPVTGELKDGLGEQVRAAIANLAAVLAAEGLGLEDVVKTTCFLTNIDDFAEFDAVYREVFPQPLPARSTVGVALAGDLLFEIEAWAVRP